MSKSNITRIQDLPYSTGECDLGPEIFLRAGRVSIRYDNEAEFGVVWTEVLFTTAVALRTIPDASVTEDLVSAYSRVCEIGESPWLRSLLGEGADSELPEGLRHFVIYFDHFGAVEVVAVAFKVLARDE